MVNTSCAVFRCDSTSHRSKGLKFHQFPRDQRSQLWIQACKRPDLLDKDADQLKHVHVCSLHFEQRMYGKLLLKKSAIPTLNLPTICTTDNATQTDYHEPRALTISTSQGVQTDMNIVDDEPYNIREIKRMKGDTTDLDAVTLQHFLELCDVFLPYNLSVVVKGHIAVSRNSRY